MEYSDCLQNVDREVEIYKKLIYLIECDIMAEENGEKFEDEKE